MLRAGVTGDQIKQLQLVTGDENFIEIEARGAVHDQRSRGRTCFTPTIHRRWWRRPCAARWSRRLGRCRSTTSSPPARRRSSRTCGARRRRGLDRDRAGLTLIGRQPAVGETAGRGSGGVPRSERRQGRCRQGGQPGTERARALRSAWRAARPAASSKKRTGRAAERVQQARGAIRPLRHPTRTAGDGHRRRPEMDLYLRTVQRRAAARQDRAPRPRISSRASI